MKAELSDGQGMGKGERGLLVTRLTLGTEANARFTSAVLFMLFSALRLAMFRRLLAYT